MKRKTFKTLLITGIIAAFLIGVFFISKQLIKTEEIVDNIEISDYEDIIEKDTLVAIIGYNSISYFIYQGLPMGYQLELLQRYTKHIGVELKLITNNDIDSSFRMLNQGKCDIVAMNLTPSKEREKFVNFTSAHSSTAQVLVQRKPEGWRSLTYNQLEDTLIRYHSDLDKKVIYVPAKSSFIQRLNNLSEEINGNIEVVEVEEHGSEMLISWVADGLIDYTVADENLAAVNTRYYDNIDVKTQISFEHDLAWAVNKQSPELTDSLNNWMQDFILTHEYRTIFIKYYTNSNSSKIFNSEFLSINTNKISKYDDLFKKYAAEIDYDWRLIASIAFQESRFEEDVVSWAGAVGLMQLMPMTSQALGFSDVFSPEMNIQAGCAYIKWLESEFIEVEDPAERIKMMIASYNVGPQHIFDAMELAKKYGDDPHIWEDNVEKWLINKTEARYYTDPVVFAGYCPGYSVVRFVDDIMDRYDRYLEVFE